MKNKVSAKTNVFEDLNLKNPDELSTKAELTRQVYELVKERKLIQTEVAELTGIRQPDISKLLNGKFTGFSIDRLLGILNSLGRDVDIVVKKREGKIRPGGMRVKVG